LGLFIAVSVSEVFEAQTFSNFFRFPMIFLCGLFVPVLDLPIYIRPLSFIFPLTYGVDIFKTSINNAGFMPLWSNYLALLGFALVLFGFSIRNIKEKWIL
jgi:ABC-2 type transport system permease protein